MLLAGALALLLLVLLVLALRVDRFGQVDRAAPAPAIVVLGAAVKDGAASPALRARVERAVELHQAGLSPLLVFTGGGAGVTEARVALELATRLGVAAASCLLEEQSRTTQENARFTAPLLKERGIREVVLVSDPFHLFRGQLWFRREGIAVLPSPASLRGRTFTARDRAYWTLREVWALLLSPTLLWPQPPTMRR